MKKPGIKRILIGLAQHLVAAGILLAVAGIMLNSYIEMDAIDGKKIYRIFPVNNRQEFEESEVYHDLFRNAIQDITQLVAIKDVFETNGMFDPLKKIDVTEYAGKIGADKGGSVSAVYDLDDLIRWGKHGVSYTNHTMSISNFVNNFGYIIYPENYSLDEYEQLCFDGFYRRGEDTPETGMVPSGEDGLPVEGGVPAYYGKSEEELAVIKEEIRVSKYTRDQLEDLAFAYIMAQNPEGIEMSREDGVIRVTVPILNSRYATVEGEKQLIRLADNWVDYLRLQNNLVVTIESLAQHYSKYQVCNSAYEAGKSNVKYAVRMMTDDGIRTYANVPDLGDASDEEMTELFSEYRRYLIYYPDSLVFMGNTVMSEEEIYKYISAYDYAYPDTTHIWLGIDTDYTARDAFYNANAVYERIVSNMGRYIALFIILLILWLGMGIYLSVTAGVTVQEDGEKVCRLRRFDHIWTEALILLTVLFVLGGRFGFQQITDIAENTAVTTEQTEESGLEFSRLYQYGVFAAYGIYLSVAAGIVWYSFVRRTRVRSLWRDSLLRHIGRGSGKVLRFIVGHRNSVISILLPYNLFLFINLVAVVGVFWLWKQGVPSAILVICTVAFDGFVGVMLFRRGAEQNEIVDGINRIRNGEVDYQLDTAALHGANKELADAVNNIGEGIGKAVKTSMRDEQLKADLITNVSHDIKTPLTSIINYVDLLKRLEIREEPAKGYIDILDSKAQRLKQLTDDLVEASKISSGNIELDREKVNLTELLNQGIGEFSDKLEESGLQVVFEESGGPAYILADSRRMWRVVENLLNNICKYALEGTRVYFDVEVSNGRVRALVKNISRQQMNIKPEELTERFIRGDLARSTEGSGLGLSIAQSLTRLQGGEFSIYLDGDLFKTTLSFPCYSGQPGNSGQED